MSPPSSFDMKSTNTMNGVLTSNRSEMGDSITDETGESAPKDSFLNYFFGGAGKNERPALGSQEMMTKAQYAPPMSVNSMMESEMVKKLEQASLNNEAIVATDREELETQLIRK
jgi:dynamin 1-like protein